MQSASFSKLFPSAIVNAYGGAEKFDQIKVIDSCHLRFLEGSLKRDYEVTDPVMVGIKNNQKVFIVLTYDVYDEKGKKILKKISEVFHDAQYGYEVDNWVKKWSGYSDCYSGWGSYKFDEEVIADRVQRLSDNNSIHVPYFCGKGTFLKLFIND